MSKISEAIVFLDFMVVAQTEIQYLWKTPSSYTHVLPAFNPWGAQQHWLDSGINATSIYCMLILGLEQIYTSGQHPSWKMPSLSILMRNKNKSLCKFCVPNIMEKKKAGIAWEMWLGYVIVSSKAVRRGLSKVTKLRGSYKRKLQANVRQERLGVCLAFSR